MDFRNLGPSGPRISALGLGCMGMSDFYGPADEATSIATIHAAQEAGITWLDTGDFYGMGHNELLLRDALKGGRRDRAFIAVKFGAQRDPSGAFIGFDGRPSSVKTALAYTLKRLGTDHIDLYQPARLDPAVPIEETVGAIAELVAAGYVRHIGLSEMGAATIRRAHATHPIAALQIEYSLMSRGPEAEIMPLLTELGIALNPYGVLSRGLLGGTTPGGRGDFRSHSPRFQGENFVRNQKLATALAAVAAERGATSAQLAIAWVLAQGPHVIPLVGARTPARLAEALGALALRLTPEDLAALEAAVPAEAVAGTRYDAHQMQMLDSERPAA
ncbi:aldo/keto reductase [Falsiroseomonas sp.]|uniref:aldo/keto reductase n=1 Tax=Falsiroseomonas sp. TaxID=2870721 RepID=UPI003F70D10B